MKQLVKKLILTVGVLVSFASLAACGGSTTQSKEGVSVTVDVATQGLSMGTLIDVRTVEEFAAGHLEGAVNHNVEDGSLAQVLDSLDPTMPYSVYCKSGRRSAIAMELLKKNGFTNITDLGGISEAAQSTGIAVVSN